MNDERRDALDFERIYAAGSRDFSRTLTAIAGGALGVSLIFAHDLAPDPCAKPLLIASWALFALSLIACLFSFPLSQVASREAVKAVHDGEEPDYASAANEGVTALNITAGVTLGLGIVGLVIFASVNL